MEPQTPPIDRTSPRGLTGELVLRLTERIQDGAFRTGEKLPAESALMEAYGVSRTVVREAVSQLRAAGLVQTQQGRGSYVLTAPGAGRFVVDAESVRTPEDVSELLDLRMGIECEAAALAAQRRTEAQLARIRRLAQAFEDCADRPREAVDADLALHLAIAGASRNRHFVALLTSIGPMMIAMPRARLQVPADAPPGRDAPGGAAPGEEPAGGLRAACGEHAAIVEAIAREEPETARAAVRLHLAGSRARLLS